MAEVKGHDTDHREEHQRGQGHQFVCADNQAEDDEVQPDQSGCKSKHDQDHALVSLDEFRDARGPGALQVRGAVKDREKDQS